MMKLYLQFGHGMMVHGMELLSSMKDVTAILSPRDMDHRQIKRFGERFVAAGGKTLLDPQLYAIGSRRQKLTQHAYWPSTQTIQRSDCNRIISELLALNDVGKTSAFILPGLLCNHVSAAWITQYEEIINVAQQYIGKRIGTLCLSEEIVCNWNSLEQVLLQTEQWQLDGYYIVATHPRGQYFVDNPLWLVNLLSFCAGLKLQGKEVILGYVNQQSLCFSCAGVDAIASGTWKNVRCFTLDKFSEFDEGFKRRSLWYYCAQAFSEIKPQFLDKAFHSAILKTLDTGSMYSSKYADVLFSGAIPTTTGYNESSSFKHYLSCLAEQCFSASKSSFLETLRCQKESLVVARHLLVSLHQDGIFGQDRDFSGCVDVTLAALNAFDSKYGYLMEQRWRDL